MLDSSTTTAVPVPAPPAVPACGPTPLDAAMDAFAAGDDAAFTTVDALARPVLVRVLGRLAGDAADAADLAQDTLIRVVRSRHLWRPGARFLPWAHAIGRRLFLDRVRRRRSRQRAYDAIAHREAMRVVTGPDDLLVARRLAERIGAALAGLPAGQRDAVERVVLDGESVATAARQLDSAPVAVRVRVFRARRTLAAAIART